MNTYTWNIDSVKVLPQQDGLNNVVKLVSYTVSGVSIENIEVKFTGSILFDTVDPNNFTPVEQLSKDMIISWLINILNTENIYATIDSKIESIKAQELFTEVNLLT